MFWGFLGDEKNDYMVPAPSENAMMENPPEQVTPPAGMIGPEQGSGASSPTTTLEASPIVNIAPQEIPEIQPTEIPNIPARHTAQPLPTAAIITPNEIPQLTIIPEPVQPTEIPTITIPEPMNDAPQENPTEIPTVAPSPTEVPPTQETGAENKAKLQELLTNLALANHTLKNRLGIEITGNNDTDKAFILKSLISSKDNPNIKEAHIITMDGIFTVKFINDKDAEQQFVDVVTKIQDGYIPHDSTAFSKFGEDTEGVRMIVLASENEEFFAEAGNRIPDGMNGITLEQFNPTNLDGIDIIVKENITRAKEENHSIEEAQTAKNTAEAADRFLKALQAEQLAPTKNAV